jgi:transposase InsO family protein
MRGVRSPTPSGQSWKTFIKNNARDIWSCDFLQTYDFWFRPIFAFFVINVSTREVIHVGVTRNPTTTWTAQQLCNVTPFGEGPKFIIRDRDDKFGAEFDRAAKGSGIRVVKTAVRTPNMNAHCERLLRSVRTECLDYFLIADEPHMRRVLGEYVAYYNASRPHQGLNQRIPNEQPRSTPNTAGDVVGHPVLNGLHHDYQRVA